MFYSDTILARKGPLASIWLAAHWDRRLSKHQIMTTDVSESIKEVMSGQLPPMALRLSGQLLLGASKIYHRKARYLLDDCTDALTRLRLSNSGASAKDVDLPAEQVRSNQITIDTCASMPTTSSQQQQAQRSVFEDDSFDLEGFLNAPVETVNAPSRKQQNLPLTVEVGRQAVKTVDQAQQQQPVSFGGGAGEDLLGEFAGMMDEVEVGRRQSSLANGRPSDSSILAPPPLDLPDIPEPLEGGDGDDEAMELRSLKDSLPYSPLRPSISTPKQQQQQAQLPQDLFSSPASSIKRRRNASNDNPARRRRIANLVDSQTELSSGELQSQVRHHDDLLMPSNDESKNRMQSAAGAIMEPVNLSDLLSKPGALLLPAGTDLSGLFAATMSIAPSPSIMSAANPISSPKTPMDTPTAVDIPDDMIDDDPFVADADAVSVAEQRSMVAESLSSQPQQASLIDWTSLLRNKPIVLSSLIKVFCDCSVCFIYFYHCHCFLLCRTERTPSMSFTRPSPWPAVDSFGPSRPLHSEQSPCTPQYPYNLFTKP